MDRPDWSIDASVWTKRCAEGRAESEVKARCLPRSVHGYPDLCSRDYDFEYVVQRKVKGKVCFGSGLERKTLESDTKGMVSKHARTFIKENFPNVSPTNYDTLPKTSALSALLNKPTSKQGTVLGGRKAERKTGLEENVDNPGPGDYSIPTTFPDNFKQSCAPFNTTSERGKENSPNIPGVGIYNVAPYKRRRAAFAYSFGGKKCLLSTVKTKCGPFNFDTCERCKKSPEGDYWSLDPVEVQKINSAKKVKQAQSEGIFLCRRCYDIEKKANKIFTKGQMRNFNKVRDCSKIHFHDGCKAKLFLVPPKEIAKVKEREAYLALYFS